ncbi:MAG: glycosyltransferase [Candidatus Edwardsbacteria bacterium]
MLDLSICIVSYNVRDLLQQCLNSVYGTVKEVSFEVIVVDNNSKDGTVEMIRDEFPQVKLLINEKNYGFAKAQNQAMRESQGRYIYLLDSDTVVMPRSIDSLVRFMEEHPEAGAVGAKLIFPDGRLQYSRRRFPSFLPVFIRGLFLDRVLPSLKSVREYKMMGKDGAPAAGPAVEEVDWLFGGNLMVRREVLEDVGFYDERFYIYCEDIDWCYRMQERGWKRFYFPESSVIHFKGAGTKQQQWRMYFEHLKSFYRLFAKHHFRLNRSRVDWNRNIGEVPLLITIVNYNTSALLEECLTSIYRNPPRCNFRVCVVDNASKDRSVEIVKENFPKVELLLNFKNLGFAKACNQAIRLIQSKYVVVLNPDVKVLPKAFEELIKFMEKNPEVGICGAKLLNVDGSVQYSARRFYKLKVLILKRTFLGRLFPENRSIREHLMSDWDHREAREVDWLLGTCLMVRRKAIEEVGGMDECFFLYFEDVDWCYRMSKYGWKVFYVPQAEMFHRHLRESAGRGFTWLKSVHFRSLLKFIFKYGGFVQKPKEEPGKQKKSRAPWVQKRKVAIVHDYLNQYGGAERVLEILHSLFPEAPVYTLLYSPEHLSKHFNDWNIRTSFMQRLPLIEKHYEKYLLLYPTAVEQFDFQGYELIISFSSSWAKGVITTPNTLHISYCTTPMRFVWDWYQPPMQSSYNPLRHTALSFFLNYLRRWDVTAANRVDYFLAISETVKKRIEKYYRRKAEVIYPPVDSIFFRPNNEKSIGEGDYFLVVSRLKPYKRIDIAVEAFNRLELPLLIVGDGPEKRNLESMAKRNIKFLGRVSDGILLKYYQNCKALIFPTLEDFGLTSLEAQACGRPVIAFKDGGALETVIEGKTGVFFYPQTKEALIETVKNFDPNKFNPVIIRQNALQFDISQFKRKIKEFIEKTYNDWQRGKQCYSQITQKEHRLHRRNADYAKLSRRPQKIL